MRYGFVEKLLSERKNKMKIAVQSGFFRKWSSLVPPDPDRAVLVLRDAILQTDRSWHAVHL
jgi:hypothetical protein